MLSRFLVRTDEIATSTEMIIRLVARLGGIESSLRDTDAAAGLRHGTRRHDRDGTLANLSLRQLAERTRVSNPYLSQIERGKHEPRTG